MIIRAKTFRDWMRANFTKAELKDMVTHGVNTGWAGLAYYNDTCKLYEKFKEEIWKELAQDAEDMGYSNIVEFIASFNGAEDVWSDYQFENLLVWYMAEKIARELTEEEA